jgi:hypothetical protein
MGVIQLSMMIQGWYIAFWFLVVLPSTQWEGGHMYSLFGAANQNAIALHFCFILPPLHLIWFAPVCIEEYALLRFIGPLTRADLVKRVFQEELPSHKPPKVFEVVHTIRTNALHTISTLGY